MTAKLEHGGYHCVGLADKGCYVAEKLEPTDWGRVARGYRDLLIGDPLHNPFDAITLLPTPLKGLRILRAADEAGHAAGAADKAGRAAKAGTEVAEAGVKTAA